MSNCSRKISLLESYSPNGDGYSRGTYKSRLSPTLEGWKHHPPETTSREDRRKPPVLDPLKTRGSPLTFPSSPSARFAYCSSTKPTRCSKTVVLHRSAPSNADLSLPDSRRRGVKRAPHEAPPPHLGQEAQQKSREEDGEEPRHAEEEAAPARVPDWGSVPVSGGAFRNVGNGYHSIFKSSRPVCLYSPPSRICHSI